MTKGRLARHIASLMVLCLFLILAAGSTDTDKSASSKPQTREERIEAQFSAWDGSHRNLTKAIKASMNDPDSYKHVETVYWDMGDYLQVKTTFRGKNVFGGTVTNAVTAKVDLDGNVLEIVSQE